MNRQDGMRYAPQGKPNPVCEAGQFVFAAMALEHGHIYGMCNGLVEAGGTLKWVYDPDPAKVEAFVNTYPSVRPARSEAEILEDSEVKLVAAAAVPSERCALGLRAMDHGKDYFTDKTPFTTLEQLDSARQKVKRTGQKYMVYYSERLHVESAVYAGQLIEEGAIGRVIQVMGTGPHRLNAPSRPGWFFDREKYGGILCDIGSHQVEQFLHFAGCRDARVLHSKVANYANKRYPELEDFGDATLVGDNGATNYFRVDWFTPDGLGTWGDGRTIILGTEGYIELRKYIDIARSNTTDHVYMANHEGEYYIQTAGKVGFPFFGQLILDCLERTERAMTQQHAFKAAECALIAQAQAVRVE
ncbi:Gfo/Idh/MocA family protein [Paenibacillus apiarius]|uniref:Gfo/Idh/MocA family oxidoreductase n=1 Tax=Paenibacillus apiarius TaxID=46240 RepID=A0ABT4DPS5_9BACL|nr:Gfo/Idh/MocA family oxidoreductase [Paenibacillus apiarius]MCY9517175.1 Gfo/Idh/MocA family oxidoreductase [Paenibacillus apiarius]MCY9519230.1 Gfo/Idh/MocA family oxidoreductase [Paenibacillus apiarius]MCY9555158.1 Gfo/Idh/MocA family oxidoreductase [Paenibacillus apiarius]MCY9559974.1 Gfo/Idh/MocA family oxidoreductase [Paenibacillus apiarius]MCY9683383.1 Gfo/Idh/MocA family oxidoreductase [Paenibacillus apiarius]